MKKLSFIIFSTLFFLAGCTSRSVLPPSPSPFISIQPSQQQAISPSQSGQTLSLQDSIVKTLTERTLNNIQTKAFEGFTRNSTYNNVVSGCRQRGLALSEARVLYAQDFLGYPSNMECTFSPILQQMTFYVLPDRSSNYKKARNDILGQLDMNLGKHFYSHSKFDGSDDYFWQHDAYTVEMWTRANYFESTGILAEVHVKSTDPALTAYEYNYWGVLPDIFKCDLGMDFELVNGNQKPSTTQGMYAGFGYLLYLQDNVTVRFSFTLDPSTKAILLDEGYYSMSGKWDKNSSIDLFESVADSMQKVLGVPTYRQYDYSEEGSVSTANEMKKLDYDSFGFSAVWQPIDFSANYDKDTGTSLTLHFLLNSFCNNVQ